MPRSRLRRIRAPCTRAQSAYTLTSRFSLSVRHRVRVQGDKVRGDHVHRRPGQGQRVRGDAEEDSGTCARVASPRPRSARAVDRSDVFRTASISQRRRTLTFPPSRYTGQTHRRLGRDAHVQDHQVHRLMRHRQRTYVTARETDLIARGFSPGRVERRLVNPNLPMRVAPRTRHATLVAHERC